MTSDCLSNFLCFSHSWFQKERTWHFFHIRICAGTCSEGWVALHGLPGSPGSLVWSSVSRAHGSTLTHLGFSLKCWVWFIRSGNGIWAATFLIISPVMPAWQFRDHTQRYYGPHIKITYLNSFHLEIMLVMVAAITTTNCGLKQQRCILS